MISVTETVRSLELFARSTKKMGQVPALLICRFVMFVLAWCFDLLPSGDNESKPAESGMGIIFLEYLLNLMCFNDMRRGKLA